MRGDRIRRGNRLWKERVSFFFFLKGKQTPALVEADVQCDGEWQNGQRGEDGVSTDEAPSGFGDPLYERQRPAHLEEKKQKKKRKEKKFRGKNRWEK